MSASQKSIMLRAATVACVALILFLAAAAAHAAPSPPTITHQSVSNVSKNAATLKATVNPGERETRYRFDYVTQESFEAEGFEGAISVPVPNGTIPAGNSDVAVKVHIEGLSPGTAYRFHLFAKNPSKVTGEDVSFTTLGQPPVFGPCPNDPFRSGEHAPLGHPAAALPDCRAYEQATPVDKDGGDVYGDPAFVHAAAIGAGVTFGSTYGVPGAEGAQELPFFAAVRGAGQSGWQTQGLLPPAITGDKAKVRGWLPDMSASFAEPTRLTNPRTHAFYELHRDGSPATQIAPYIPSAHGRTESYFYDGTSADGNTVVFESFAALPAAAGEEPIAGAVAGSPNVYAWDRVSGRLSLASAMNSVGEAETSLPQGAFAGPYAWAWNNTSAGGAGPEAFYYLQDKHAVATDGSVYFTATVSGHLYRRINPTMPQSEMEDGRCIQPEKACTLDLSAPTRTPPDPAGPRPAAFQLASADGSTVFFTSAEKLTDDANTGPVQDPARIGRATIGAEKAEDLEPDLLPANALGMAVDPQGEYLYWANPADHSIGRAKLDAEGRPTLPEPDYIDTGETSFLFHPVQGEPELLTAPSIPRYVAVDEHHVYWTNTGPLHALEPRLPSEPMKDAGTIGRATIGAQGSDEIEPEFITGASDPQGIAVNATDVYWANALTFVVGRASIVSGAATEVRQKFFDPGGQLIPFGVALDATHMYLDVFNDIDGGSAIYRTSLEGDTSEGFALGESKPQSIVRNGPYLYWISESNHTIGRIPVADFPPSGFCGAISSCDSEFAAGLQGNVLGLATLGTHLYWSSNGEAPPNPGNDLYRYEAGVAKPLTDLTPDATADNGAEVQGVLGGSADGSYLYFVANGVLASNDGADGSGPAQPGDCKAQKSNITQSSGECNLYLLHDAVTEFIARVPSSAGGALAWTPTPAALISRTSKTSVVTADGRTLLLRSSGRLTAYDNSGLPEFYRYQSGEGISCVSCNPGGAAAEEAPDFQRLGYPGTAPNFAAAALVVHLLSADGSRAFFDTTEALVGADTNGDGGCPPVTTPLVPSCIDVYEWEAPGSGSCTETTSAYSVRNQGCIYMISNGAEEGPSLFADASPSGSDVYFFTRQHLVSQDGDQLYDIYDARTDGGLAAQNPLPPPLCEGEASCMGPAAAPPPFAAPPNFSGAPNPKPKKSSCKKKAMKKAKGMCVKQGKHGNKRHQKHGKTGGSK
jgi:hypothetical protein